MKKWKVKFQDLRAKKTRRPFFNQEEIVEANSRKEAIEKVKSDHAFVLWKIYGNYKASPLKR